MTERDIPEGMIAVSKDEFFKLLTAEKLDIMPQVQQHTTDWEAFDRVAWGWSIPGWKSPGDPKIWAVRKDVYEKAGS